jgi:hypothetical protein
MPYERKGKCVYNKETGKKKGCSSSATKAKKYMKALYASELQERVQKTVKKIINEQLTQEKQQIQEGRLAKILGGVSLLAALAGVNASIENDPTMQALEDAYEQAEIKGDEVKMKELKDKITKQAVYLSAGEGEEQSVDEKLKGGQKKLDANKDGKISGEDFKLLQKEGGEGRTENYMFFSNLKQMQRQIEFLMEINPQVIDMILQNGHDWADDHVTEAKTNMDQVFDFIMNEIK